MLLHQQCRFFHRMQYTVSAYEIQSSGGTFLCALTSQQSVHHGTMAILMPKVRSLRLHGQSALGNFRGPCSTCRRRRLCLQNQICVSRPLQSSGFPHLVEMRRLDKLCANTLISGALKRWQACDDLIKHITRAHDFRILYCIKPADLQAQTDYASCLACYNVLVCSKFDHLIWCLQACDCAHDCRVPTFAHSLDALTQSRDAPENLLSCRHGKIGMQSKVGQ